jgi:LysR family hydrogen peroxide-inducible transcriptional activator
VVGKAVIAQARAVLKEVMLLTQTAKEMRVEQAGELRIGMIPTLAPYLLPLFLGGLLATNPSLKVAVEELTTEVIMERLAREQLDVGIMATPLNVAGLREEPLFQERFLLYISPKEPLGKKQYVLPSDIDPDRLWLLEEGHCLRSQVIDLCELREQGGDHGRFEFLSGSISALERMVDAQGGITIIPELAIVGMSAGKRKQVREFKAPVPVREISTVTYRHFIKDRLLSVLRDSILAGVGPHLKRPRTARVVPITA